MVVDTVNEKLCVNKLISQKREVLLIEGDMIVPDSKPDSDFCIAYSNFYNIRRYRQQIGKAAWMDKESY